MSATWTEFAVTMLSLFVTAALCDYIGFRRARRQLEKEHTDYKSLYESAADINLRLVDLNKRLKFGLTNISTELMKANRIIRELTAYTEDPGDGDLN